MAEDTDGLESAVRILSRLLLAEETLEATLMSPVPMPVILIYSSLWNYFLSAVRFTLYLMAGVALGAVHFDSINVASTILVFVLTVLSFLGIGILWAGLVLLVKRGEAIMTLLSTGVLLISGVLFPTRLLPGWVQSVSDFIPLTAALEGMRLAVLTGSGLNVLTAILMKLSLFAAVLLTVGFHGFNFAVKIGRRQGSLTQY